MIIYGLAENQPITSYSFFRLGSVLQVRLHCFFFEGFYSFDHVKSFCCELAILFVRDLISHIVTVDWHVIHSIIEPRAYLFAILFIITHQCCSLDYEQIVLKQLFVLFFKEAMYAISSMVYCDVFDFIEQIFFRFNAIYSSTHVS